MKTTIELPDDLVRKIKLHAVRDGKKVKDAFADLLRKGLKSIRSEARIAWTIYESFVGERRVGWAERVRSRDSVSSNTQERNPLPSQRVSENERHS